VPFSLTRDVISPTVTITVPACSAVVTVAVAWSGDDPSAGFAQHPERSEWTGQAGCGVASYDVQVRAVFHCATDAAQTTAPGPAG
jgi:hypothetical protein